MFDNSTLYNLLTQKRISLGIESGGSDRKCRRVNIETIAFINMQTSLTGIVLIDPNFGNFKKKNLVGEHVIGMIETPERRVIGFDGTWDQINGSEGDILIIEGNSQMDVLRQIKEVLGGNFFQYYG